jgi:hypothetical protein
MFTVVSWAGGTMKGSARLGSALFAMASLLWGITPDAAAQSGTAKATGPIAVDKDDYPFLQASRVQTVVDLGKLGYVEEEFFVSGTANVYDWAADGTVVVKAAGAPYTTRILVRRPANPARFSGAVILEPFENARSYDWSFLWAASHEYFTEHGDAWVGVTHNPQAMDTLRKFNAKRYASLSMANPVPAEVCGANQAKSATELGLKFDMLSQVGTLLKNPTGPLAGFKVEAIYPTSHTGEIVTYMNAIHPRAKLPDGKPIFDGYLIKGDQGPTAIRRCSPAPTGNDPRQLTKNVGVPVIRVVAEGDVIDGYPLRRADSDEPSDRFRLYEVAAAPHMDIRYYQHMPAVDDQSKAGVATFTGVWPFAYQCERRLIGLLELPVFQVALNAAFFHLDQWTRKGAAPPRAERMTVRDAGTPKATIATDQHGNGTGGVRNPYVDVPVATYVPHTPGQAVCRNLGYKVPFDWTKLEALYGSSKNYAQKVNESVRKLVKEGWILESDAKRVTADLLPR